MQLFALLARGGSCIRFKLNNHLGGMGGGGIEIIMVELIGNKRIDFVYLKNNDKK